MKRIQNLMRGNLSLVDLEAKDRVDAFRRISIHLRQEGWISEDAEEELFGRLIRIEEPASTCLGRGVSVPHVYFEKVPEAMIVFAHLASPVDFGGKDGMPVSLVFLVMGPKRDDTEHLMILARLTRLLKDEEFRRRLEAAASGAEVMEAVRDVEMRH